MVSIVWFILSVCNVCSFSWWPVFIESIIVGIASLILSSNSNNYIIGILGAFDLGIMAFAAMKLFCGLTISPWWLLIAWIWFALAIIVPGGFACTYLWFDHLNIIMFSKGQLVFLIIVDVLLFVALTYSFITEFIIEKRKKAKKSDNHNYPYV